MEWIIFFTSGIIGCNKIAINIIQRICILIKIEKLKFQLTKLK